MDVVALSLGGDGIDVGWDGFDSWRGVVGQNGLPLNGRQAAGGPVVSNGGMFNPPTALGCQENEVVMASYSGPWLSVSEA